MELIWAEFELVFQQQKNQRSKSILNIGAVVQTVIWLHTIGTQSGCEEIFDLFKKRSMEEIKEPSSSTE